MVRLIDRLSPYMFYDYDHCQVFLSYCIVCVLNNQLHHSNICSYMEAVTNLYTS